jgi:hypothetical protein
MLKSHALGNTVAIVNGGLKTEMRQKKDGTGTYEYNEILFRFATKRDYKGADGQYVTDFILCAIHGPLAKVFAQYCAGTKADGSIQSRRLLLEGYVKEYSKDITLDKLYVRDANGNRQVLNNVPGLTVRQDGNIFEVESFEFADANPAKAQGNAVTAMPIQTQVAPVQAIAPVAPVVPAGYDASQGPWS